jgi:L-threonylcarbamoyladenylate synthase
LDERPCNSAVVSGELRCAALSDNTFNVKTLLTQSSDVAAEFIRRGGTVAFPTETVYGLGADAFNEAAVRKIFEAKHRPPDNPLIVHIGAVEQIAELARKIPGNAQKLIDAFFPGPLAIVLPKTERVPGLVTAGLDTVAVRMPSPTVAREFLRACARPVAAPSANLSGRPSPTTWQAVVEDLDGRIDCVLQSDPTVIGIESTVVDCTSEMPVLLRKGGVPLERLREVVGEVDEFALDESNEARSPGLRHTHYSPNATVVIVQPGEEIAANASDGFIGLQRRTGEFGKTLVCVNADAYARELFEFFRECDRQGVERIFCEAVPEEGIGAALMDRLRRAADK